MPVASGARRLSMSSLQLDDSRKVMAVAAHGRRLSMSDLQLDDNRKSMAAAAAAAATAAASASASAAEEPVRQACQGEGGGGGGGGGEGGGGEGGGGRGGIGGGRGEGRRGSGRGGGAVVERSSSRSFSAKPFEEDSCSDYVSDHSTSSNPQSLLLSASKPVASGCFWSILNPHSRFVRNWNKFFVVTCLTGVFIDPLIFFIFGVDGEMGCMYIRWRYALILTILRCITDLVHVFHIVFQFRIAYTARRREASSRPVLITNRKKIAYHYVKSCLILDVVAVLPLFQLAIWVLLPYLDAKIKRQDSLVVSFKTYLLLIILLQFVPRLLRIIPLMRRMERATGFVFETAWSSFLINFLVLLLASHIVGAIWYMLSIERLDGCMEHSCAHEVNCVNMYLDCPDVGNLDASIKEYTPKKLADRARWLNSSVIMHQCFHHHGGEYNFAEDDWQYGIYEEALPIILGHTKPLQLYLRCFFWGLQNLSNLADLLIPSGTSVSELLFCITIIITGLLLFALLVGNMQGFLHSLNKRKDEMRLRRKDMESWMRHMGLPSNITKRVRDYHRHKWAATRGVPEEEILEDLPEDLCFDIRSHLCLPLIQKVPLFAQMGEPLQKDICRRLKLQLFMKKSPVVLQGDPMNAMYFLLRGSVEERTTYGSQQSSVIVGHFKEGEVIGLELLDYLFSRSQLGELGNDGGLSRAEQSQREQERGGRRGGGQRRGGRGDNAIPVTLRFQSSNIITDGTSGDDGQAVESGQFRSPYTLMSLEFVEAFRLSAEDIKDILQSFQSDTSRLRQDQQRLQRAASRRRSLPWRVWAAMTIQRAWRSHVRRRSSQLPPLPLTRSNASQQQLHHRAHATGRRSGNS
ncbi:hypothetical protein CBR_g8849 [Chara braunii]|uniref:Cyclic nucleotide-binding domain-containing protein n=1 Tax=Chara braunii TaxID=69332 RepID=A0A388KN00_CHABU|nr:hypothetical protein CBR_g8849 [Chara braunii]|eukprot:GBG71430.1 hypothetical protein CBR_g8849 [Chara braunii]